MTAATRRRKVPGMSTQPAIASLSAGRARPEVAWRWLRPLAPLVLIVVVGAALVTHPRPGLAGHGLAVSIALTGFVLAGAGALGSDRRPVPVQLTLAVLLLAAAATLMWLQPDGVAIAGIFVAVSRSAVLLRGHRSVPLIVIALVAVIVLVAAAGHVPVSTAILDAIMLASFYGAFFLAMRLGDANRRAERLLIELEGSRAAQAEAAGLAERQRLAREMHDVLAHSLSGLLLQLEAARLLVAADPGDPRLPVAVERAHHLGRSGLEEARRAIGMLRDDELPGVERLAGLAEQFERDQGVPCHLSVTGPAHELGSEAKLAVYRVTQEALTNITRHARPERVEICLTYAQETTRLTVQDFGSPTATAAGEKAAGESDGYGLTGMRERAELLGGTLAAGPTADGFRVELGVPA